MNRLYNFYRELYWKTYDWHPWNIWNSISIKIEVRKFPPGTLFSNCGDFPCVVIENAEGEIYSWNMARQHFGCCSQFNCGPKKITEAQATEMVRLYKEGGERALMMYAGYTKEEVDKFFKAWRPESIDTLPTV